MKTKLEFDGMKELSKALKELPIRVESRLLQNSINYASKAILPDIIAAAPRNDGINISQQSKRFGSLHSNIKIEKRRSRRKTIKFSSITIGNAFWGFFLEFGTRFMAAKPWFVPAFEKSISKGLSTIKATLEKKIEKEFEKLAKGK